VTVQQTPTVIGEITHMVHCHSKHHRVVDHDPVPNASELCQDIARALHLSLELKFDIIECHFVSL